MKKSMFYVLALTTVLTTMICSCGRQGKTHTETEGLVFDRILVDTIVTLENNGDTSRCELSLDILCARGKSARIVNDSIACSGVFSTDFFNIKNGSDDSISLYGLVDSFVSECISHYKTECGDLIKKGFGGASCNREYIVRTEVLRNKPGIVTYMIYGYTFTGGAHGSSFVRALNFEESTGNKIGKSDFFVSGSDSVLNGKAVERLAEQYQAKGLGGLREQGLFMFRDVYVPDNFILGKDSVTFIYMTDEMAPHSMGEIRFSLAYSDIAECLAK